MAAEITTGFLYLVTEEGLKLIGRVNNEEDENGSVAERIRQDSAKVPTWVRTPPKPQ